MDLRSAHRVPACAETERISRFLSRDRTNVIASRAGAAPFACQGCAGCRVPDCVVRPRASSTLCLETIVARADPRTGMPHGGASADAATGIRPSAGRLMGTRERARRLRLEHRRECSGTLALRGDPDDANAEGRLVAAGGVRVDGAGGSSPRGNGAGIVGGRHHSASVQTCCRSAGSTVAVYQSALPERLTGTWPVRGSRAV